MATDPLHGLLHIGAAAEAVGCCQATLRNYVCRGYLTDRRDSANRRVFTPADVRRALSLLRRQGLPRG